MKALTSQNAYSEKDMPRAPFRSAQRGGLNDFLGSVIYFLLSDFSLKVGNGEAYHG
jgi:hypothetical protein